METVSEECRCQGPMSTALLSSSCTLTPFPNKLVYERMEKATSGLKGDKFNKAYDSALDKIRAETADVGSELNRLATGGKKK